jgi:hypothetical protein
LPQTIGKISTMAALLFTRPEVKRKKEGFYTLIANTIATAAFLRNAESPQATMRIVAKGKTKVF